MKKVFLSLAAVAVLSVVSCKKADAESTEVVADSTAVETEAPADSTAVAPAATTETPAATPAK